MITAAQESLQNLTKKDFTSDQEVRWCPGCGDYAILSATQKAMAQLGVPRENIVFISGIGCSSRFPYYMNTYGIHSIHGRAPAFATGLKLARPELEIFMVTGDGDGLSIGGNHLLHILRRNVDVTILMFNNQIYGLTKGQYSPTSSLGKRTKSSPLGSIDYPLNPISFALASEATFVARTVDTMSSHLEKTLVDASRHRGVSFIEILQNCPIFNDGVWDRARDSKSRKDSTAQLVDGEPVVFGADNEKVLCLSDREFKVAGRGEVAEEDLYIHRESDPSPTTDYLLSRLQFPEFPFILGKFRTWTRPTYDSMLLSQIDEAKATQDSGLDKIFRSGDVWEVK